MSDVPVCNLVIFGAKGDLTRRKLLPSLYQLEKYGKLPEETKILGVGRADWDKSAYSEVAKEALTTFMSEPLDEDIWQRFSQRLNFHKLDVNDIAGFNDLKNKLEQNRTAIFYFAMHPGTFGTICKGLAHAGLNQKHNRIVMEKPLGTDLQSSRDINDSVAKFFDESQVYRIDHYLGKESVLNLLALRFANPVFASLWNRNSIDHVEITVAEQVGIEGRWGYFDKAGQMRDMVQNHLLQILTMIAMSPPANLKDESLRNEKIAVLNALRPIDKTNLHDKVVRGQYTSGFVNGINVPGYLEEDGANKESSTETFVAIRVDIDNWRWAGVPFYLRTGKRLASKCAEVVVYFKSLPLNIFSESYPALPQNKLTIRLQPDEGLDIEILNKVPGLDSTHNLQTTKLDLSFNEAFQQHSADAYERLLLEVMRGRQALFVHRDEVEAAWKWVDSIISAWNSEKEPPKTYQAGTWGPVASVALITKDGHSWHEFE
ncbi:glucose-6-phosphate dehydrogenase [Gilliamella sp. wkB308]|uniref:glucose-6-phosphate dehydrogenase n=1 Tax=Gilliamella sp. wkB308 TaxID=3120263 RepID=UPI00080DC5C1|nr:glucose-6-phosphate dehydrogenase [Gilliamella apicola]OCF96530.1 glucose-6-phosphate dehydrogenase [Gilliamella apicola]